MSGSGNLNLNGILMTENATNGTSVNSSVQFFQPTTVNITSVYKGSNYQDMIEKLTDTLVANLN